jgi:hypothetical protein
MATRGSYGGGVEFGGLGGLPGRPPRDLIAILAVIFVTFAMQFFESTAIVPALLHLSPAVWRLGFVWQLATYAFSGVGRPSLWIVLELLIVYWFGADVRSRLGRKGFWALLARTVPGAALLAVATELIAGYLAGASPTPFPFQLMQGQRVLLAILVAAFATLYRDATILAFFVLPVRARWFLWLELVIAFIAYLGTKDIAGLVGIFGATGITVWTLSRPRSGGTMRRRWLRWRRARLERRVDRLARRRGLHIVDHDDAPKGPTIN